MYFVQPVIMKNSISESPSQRRLAELETEGQSIIDMYLKQVKADANSPLIKKLLDRLKAVRSEQWQIFEKQYHWNVKPLTLSIAEPLRMVA